MVLIEQWYRKDGSRYFVLAEGEGLENIESRYTTKTPSGV